MIVMSSSDLDLKASGAGASLAARLRSDDTLVFLSAVTPDRGRGLDVSMGNLQMAEQVCGALAAVKPAHVVYISSDAVYRETVAFVDEDSPADAIALYGAMHAFRERMLLQALTGTGTSLAILRPTLVFGAADTHNSYGPNRFMRSALKTGKINIFGEGEEYRDHIFVDDAARLVVDVIRHGSDGVLNLVTGDSIAYGALATLVAEIGKGVAVVEQVPRSGPVTILHRHYDATAIHRTFPQFTFTPRRKALERAWAGYLAAQ